LLPTLGRTLWPVHLENSAAEEKNEKVPLGNFQLFDVIWNTEDTFLFLCVGKAQTFWDLRTFQEKKGNLLVNSLAPF
jgi:hypothetical protein